MFARKTVFVVGAGANSEFGFPLGWQLAEKIHALMHITLTHPTSGAALPLMIQAQKAEGLSDNIYMEAVQNIRKGILFSSSIDDFLNQRQKDKTILRLGKMAIVQTILEAESNSSLHSAIKSGASVTEPQMRKSWLFKLTKMLFKGISPGEEQNIFKNVRFITFNYDRSLEVFLTHAISDAFSMDIEAASQIVAKAPIHHAYGSIGQGRPDHLGELPFGYYRSDHDYVPLSERIRTYTESSTSPEEQAFIAEAMQGVGQIVFLGCGFHKQKMELLFNNQGLPGFNVGLTGTINGISPTGKDIVADRLNILFSPTVRPNRQPQMNMRAMHDMRCSDLMDEVALSLTE